MRTKNTDYISAIEKFVSSYLDDTGVSPTIREISDGTGLTKSTVADYVAYMRESGILDGDGSHRSLVTIRRPDSKPSENQSSELCPAEFPSWRRKTSKNMCDCRSRYSAEAASTFCGQTATP